MFDDKDYKELEEEAEEAVVEPDPEPKSEPETKTLNAVRLKSGRIVFE